MIEPKIDYKFEYNKLLKSSGENYIHIVDIFLILSGCTFFITLFQKEWLINTLCLTSLLTALVFLYIRYRILKKQRLTKALDTLDN